MEFAFTEEQAMIADTVRGFFAERASSQRTREAMAAGDIDRALWAAFCGELALAGVAVPESLGGAGLGMVEFALVAEAAGAQVAALPLPALAMALAALAAGGGAPADRRLAAIMAGEAVPAFSTDFVREGGGDRLTGTARFVAYAASADLLFFSAAGGGTWVVPADAPGLRITPHVTMDQTRPLAEVRLDDVAAEPLCAGARDTALRSGWLCLAAEALGGAQAALDRTSAYAKERVQFGRPIGSFQAYKHRLADMMVDIEQARSAAYWAACAIDEQSDETDLALHAAKAFCTDTFRMCAGNMIQLHGGIGFTWEHDAHLFFKRARGAGSMLGDSDWHREQVARLVIGAAA